MSLRVAALASGFVGGVCWLVRFVLDLAGSGDGNVVDLLHWIGLVLLAVALLAFGTGLVSRSAIWLRAIVGVAFPLLVWSVLEVFHQAGNPLGVDGVFGALVALVSAVGLARHRNRTRSIRGVRGAHAR